MPAIIDSAPDCVVHQQVNENDVASQTAAGEDSADFVMGDNFLGSCEGFMTFGPGSTYGDGGTGANGAYMALTWIGIVFMVAALILWVVKENTSLTRHVSGS
jgi:hypothetical protein